MAHDTVSRHVAVVGEALLREELTMAVSTGKLIDPGGCAAYSIELTVPPGTQGLEPRLAIAQSWERMTHDAPPWDLKTHARWTSGDTW